MSYCIKSGARVRIRQPNAKPTDWRPHQTRIDLRFLEPLTVYHGGYVFEYQGWRIRVRKNQIEHVVDAKWADMPLHD